MRNRACPFLHEAPFLKRHRRQPAFYIRPDVHRRDRFGPGDEFDHDGDVAPLRRLDYDRGRRRSTSAPLVASAAPGAHQ